MHFTSYKLYAAMAFETTTMGTLGVLAKEFLAFGEKTWGRLFRRLAILSMLLSTFYVLAFPTLMAAMTGYITTYEPYVQSYDYNLIEWYKVRCVRYIVHDAGRLSELGYSDGLIITEYDFDLKDAVDLYMQQFDNRTGEVSRLLENGPGLSELSNISMYSEFVVNSTSGPTTVRLDAPSLNITTFQQHWRFKLPPPSTRNQFAFALEDLPTDIYNTSYLLEHGLCKPSETYQWGFSYIFLFMVSIFNFLWACIMAGMWLDTRRGSRMYRSGRRPGLLRSILDYSAAIRQELGPEAEYLGEAELRKRLRRSGGALMVPSDELRISRVDTGEGKLRERSWRRKLTGGSTF
ncbi:uncharacterized protein SETTUDRAFT_146002 [Exserohilum turcica Et28A]|uniref:Uncharacterized protein n=1 Tax=Exserohilum turcicum (strain 28A) TaxID=671987 RepID=R0KBI4_EXST2|nr:uncharacterized protein SETTUDRAFT_146002 [Exserohilum turcica Et28A]EOA90293.1 hypothetical protein SETTUDRAFT_146002 [Exserohilum turcica Et28A]